MAWTLLGTLAYARYSLEAGAARGDVLLELLGRLACYYPWLFFDSIRVPAGAKLPAEQNAMAETCCPFHLENRLDPSKFLRIHRRRIVNISRMVAIYSMPGGTYEMELRCGIRLSTGRQYKEAILALMKPI